MRKRILQEKDPGDKVIRRLVRSERAFSNASQRPLDTLTDERTQ